jgi:hypothetical protein
VGEGEYEFGWVGGLGGGAGGLDDGIVVREGYMGVRSSWRKLVRRE